MKVLRFCVLAETIGSEDCSCNRVVAAEEECESGFVHVEDYALGCVVY